MEMENQKMSRKAFLVICGPPCRLINRQKNPIVISILTQNVPIWHLEKNTEKITIRKFQFYCRGVSKI